jgi:hypothetical protein
VAEDFEEYLKYALFKSIDTKFKINNNLNKIDEFKTDYILGYRKLIQRTQSKISSYRLSNMNRFYSKIAEKGLTNYFKDESNTLKIMKTLSLLRKDKEYLHKNIQSESLDLTRIIYHEQEYQTKYLKNLGVYINSIDDFIIKQTHNKTKLLDAGKEKWVKYIFPLLNKESTFQRKDDKYIKKILGNIFDKLTISVKNKNTFENFTFDKFLGRKKRFLHFKNIESFYQYNKNFGQHSNLFDAINESMESFARKKSIYEIWGLDPYFTKSKIDKFLIKNRSDLNEYIKKDIANENIFSNNKLFDMMMGINSTSISESSAKFHESVRAVFRMSRLQGLTASLPDLGTSVVMAKIFDIPVIKSICSIIKNFIWKNSLSDKKFAEKIGVYCEHLNSEIRNTFESCLTDSPYKNIISLNNLFFKLNLQNFWDKNIRNASCILIANKLNDIKKDKFNTLNIYIQNALKESGINELDWKCVKYLSKDNLIDPFLINNIPDKLIEKILQKNHYANDVSEYKNKLKYDLINFYHKNVNLFIPTPNDRTKLFTTGGLPAGTISGETWRYMMQFKSYPIVMITDFIENII